MITKASVLALVQELEGDARELARVAGLNARAWDRFAQAHRTFAAKLAAIAEAL